MRLEQVGEFINQLPFQVWVWVGAVCVVVIVVGVFALWRDGSGRAPAFQPEMICSNCGCSGIPKMERPGSDLVQLALMFGFVVPGIFYALWRDTATRRVCAACGAQGLVPLGSPRGIELRRVIR